MCMVVSMGGCVLLWSNSNCETCMHIHSLVDLYISNFIPVCGVDSVKVGYHVSGFI